MTTQQLVRFALRWSWLMVLGALVAAVVSYQFSSQRPRLYEAQTKLLVGSADPTSSIGGDYVAPQQASQLATTYARVITTRPVLEAAIAAGHLDLNYDEAVSMVSAAPLGNTQLVQITADAADPELAATLANQVASAFLQQIEAAQTGRYATVESALAQQVDQRAATQADLSRQVEELRNEPPTPSQNAELARLQFELAQAQQTHADTQRSYQDVMLAKARSTNPITVVDPAVPPSQPLQSLDKQSALIGGAIGLLLAVLVAYIVEHLDDRLLSPDHVERLTNLRPLGIIPRLRPEGKQGDGAEAETALEVVSANVMLQLEQVHSRTLLVAGIGARCGATSTACNLAIRVARAGRRVILVDADLAKPSLHESFGVENRAGLSWLLIHAQLPVAEHLRATGLPGLYVLPAGPQAAVARHLLASERMQLSVEKLCELADVVIFDAPLLRADGASLALAAWAHNVMLVGHARRTHAREVATLGRLVEGAGANILGVVLNRPNENGGIVKYSPTRPEITVSAGA